MNASPLPSFEFLLNCSPNSLQELELASLNRSSNLGKQITIELRAWSEQLAAAQLARWMIDNRDQLLQTNSHTVEKNPFPSFEIEPIKRSA